MFMNISAADQGITVLSVKRWRNQQMCFQIHNVSEIGLLFGRLYYNFFFLRWNNRFSHFIIHSHNVILSCGCRHYPSNYYSNLDPTNLFGQKQSFLIFHRRTNMFSFIFMAVPYIRQWIWKNRLDSYKQACACLVLLLILQSFNCNRSIMFLKRRLRKWSLTLM